MSREVRGTTFGLPASESARKLAAARDFLRSHYHENSIDYLFANRNGNSYSVGKVTEYGLWPVLKCLQIECAGLHAFRHAAAIELHEEGVVLSVVQRQLRHRDARTTLQTYGTWLAMRRDVR